MAISVLRKRYASKREPRKLNFMLHDFLWSLKKCILKNNEKKCVMLAKNDGSSVSCSCWEKTKDPNNGGSKEDSLPTQSFFYISSPWSFLDKTYLGLVNKTENFHSWPLSLLSVSKASIESLYWKYVKRPLSLQRVQRLSNPSTKFM